MLKENSASENIKCYKVMIIGYTSNITSSFVVFRGWDACVHGIISLSIVTHFLFDFEKIFIKKIVIIVKQIYCSN